MCQCVMVAFKFSGRVLWHRGLYLTIRTLAYPSKILSSIQKILSFCLATIRTRKTLPRFALDNICQILLLLDYRSAAWMHEVLLHLRWLLGWLNSFWLPGLKSAVQNPTISEFFLEFRGVCYTWITCCTAPPVFLFVPTTHCTVCV
jgi:hypothetical protein